MSKLIPPFQFNPAIYSDLVAGSTGANGDISVHDLRGKNFIPNFKIDTTTITSATTPGMVGADIAGGVLAPNGKIYFLPKSSTKVLILDPDTNTVDTTSITGLSTANKCCGGVLAPNGKIYGIPVDVTYVPIIDPETNTIDITTITNVGAAYGTDKWSGGVLAPNGKIYAIPYSAPVVLVIDPQTDTVSEITVSAGSGWRGGALSINGNIYCFPGNTYDKVLVISPVTDALSYISIDGFSGTSNWYGCVAAPTGIYAVPYNDEKAVVVYPSSSIVDSYIIGGLSGNSKWAGGVLGMDNIIYFMPFDSSNLLTIDTSNDVATLYPTGRTAPGCVGGVLARNGKIYSIAANGAYVLIIKTKLPTTAPWMLAPEFNKL